jgi:hypothetical protein
MEKDIFYDRGLLNKNKLRENWVFNNIKEYDEIKKFQTINCPNELKFSQILYNYISNIFIIPKCEYCQIKEKRFIGFTEGYNSFCSKKCASKHSLPNLLENRKKNTIEKYGVEHTSQLDSVKDKQKQTNIIRYGSSSPTMNDEVRLKQKNTMLERYGVEYSGNSSELMNKSFITRYDKYSKHISERYKNLKVVNILKEGELEIECDKCGQNYKIRTELLSLRLFRYKVNPCLICNQLSKYGDTKENEIFNYISSLGIEIIKGDRKILSGKEIDMYLPSNKLGFEFNGLYWHSELHKEKSYHLDKKNRCIDNDINLIHVWEDDWIYKKDIVISRINNLLNINIIKIMARNCEIKKVSSKDSKIFLDENHLQSNIYSSYNIGLYHNNELVSIMTFGKLRRSLGQSNGDGWELYRFCSKLNTSVTGGFSKLLKYFENDINPKMIITYANRDWSVKSNNVYEKNGFGFDSETDINYWYFGSDVKRKHRFQFRKDKLVKEGYDPNKTEVEIMSEVGYNRIFDCGNLKYIKYINF